MQLKSYASDLLEDAMMLAQSKALNSYSFRDMLNTLTEIWGYCYEKIAQIDTGYYSCLVRLTERLTRLPDCVKNVVRVFSSRDPANFSRKIYRASGQNDIRSPFTYHVSGKDLYCFDAPMRMVWLEYIPEPPFVTFTKNNRDARILEDEDVPTKVAVPNLNFGVWALDPARLAVGEYVFVHRSDLSAEPIDLTEDLMKEGCQIVSFILDCPWAFITYYNETQDEYMSFVVSNLLGSLNMQKFNPYDFTGRGSNVEYITAKFNDYTGMGVVVLDHSDGRYKELGWTPDTLLCYPSRIMYNYMVATVAQRLAALNNSNIMGAEMALINAQDEMEKWLKKDKSAWMRANNVNGPTISDFL